MKTNEKKMIITIVVIGVILVGVILIWKNNANKQQVVEGEDKGQTQVIEKYVDILEDGTKLNNSNKLKETKKLDQMEISNIQLTYKNGMAVVLGNVKNTSNKDIGLTPIKLTLYDEKGNVLEEIDGLISPVKAGESVQLNVQISKDYANAYDLKIVKR